MKLPNLKLISHTLCPYVQRARIVLAEKQIPYDIEFIDLANKPDWFLKISPTGKVPVLVADERVIFESSVIAEYLDEISAGSLHPDSPGERARHRAWMEFGSSALSSIAAFYNAADEQAFNQRRDELRIKFQKLERELVGGPYFAGEKFSLVDAVFGPVFRYFDVFDNYEDFGILDGLPEILTWRAALKQRASIRHAVVPEYAQLLHEFILQRGSWLTRLATARDAA